MSKSDFDRVGENLIKVLYGVVIILALFVAMTLLWPERILDSGDSHSRNAKLLVDTLKSEFELGRGMIWQEIIVGGQRDSNEESQLPLLYKIMIHVRECSRAEFDRMVSRTREIVRQKQMDEGIQMVHYLKDGADYKPMKTVTIQY